jgi:cbb3-type cytochrome oxidase maturation protein
MSSLFVLIPLGVVFVAIAAGFFIVGVRGGQFERLDELAHRLPDDFV